MKKIFLLIILIGLLVVNCKTYQMQFQNKTESGHWIVEKTELFKLPLSEVYYFCQQSQGKQKKPICIEAFFGESIQYGSYPY